MSLLNHPTATGVPGDLRETWPQVIAEYRKRAGRTRPALVAACPPCQGMSSARSGRGKGDDADAGSRDKRNLLVTVVSTVVKKLKPDAVVAEKVPAFLNERSDVDFHALRHTFATGLGSCDMKEAVRVKLARHSDWRQTDRYTDPASLHCSDSEEKRPLWPKLSQAGTA